MMSDMRWMVVRVVVRMVPVLWYTGLVIEEEVDELVDGF